MNVAGNQNIRASSARDSPPGYIVLLLRLSGLRWTHVCPSARRSSTARGRCRPRSRSAQNGPGIVTKWFLRGPPPNCHIILYIIGAVFLRVRLSDPRAGKGTIPYSPSDGLFLPSFAWYIEIDTQGRSISKAMRGRSEASSVPRSGGVLVPPARSCQPRASAPAATAAW